MGNDVDAECLRKVLNSIVKDYRLIRGDWPGADQNPEVARYELVRRCDTLIRRKDF